MKIKKKVTSSNTTHSTIELSNDELIIVKEWIVWWQEGGAGIDKEHTYIIEKKFFFTFLNAGGSS